MGSSSMPPPIFTPLPKTPRVPLRTPTLSSSKASVSNSTLTPQRKGKGKGASSRGSSRARVDITPDREIILLADVDTHRYTSLLDRSGEGNQAGDDPMPDPEQLGDCNYWVSKGASQQLGDLVATGFISPSDLAMLNTTAGEAQDIEDTLGKDALKLLTSVGTPRRARLKSELLRRQRLDAGDNEEDIAKDEQRNLEETNLKGLNPSVMVYYVFMQKAAERRAETRKRRRQIVSLRKEAEINELHMLMRGGEPERRRRILARTGELQPESEPGIVQEGEFYIENDVIVSYFFDPVNNRWHRLVGSSRNIVRPASDDRHKAPLEPLIDREDILPYARLLDFKRLETNEFLLCLDKAAQHTHDVHPDWYDYTYPTSSNSPLCQGLCRFTTGWVAPEGLDGVPTMISLAFDKNGEAQPTHHVCKSCGLRLCAKCYKTCVDEHHGCVWQLLSYYAEWRKDVYEHWLKKGALDAGAPRAESQSSMPRTPQPYAEYMMEWHTKRGYQPFLPAPTAEYWDPRTDGARSSAKKVTAVGAKANSVTPATKKYQDGFPNPWRAIPKQGKKKKLTTPRGVRPLKPVLSPGGPYTEPPMKKALLTFTPRRKISSSELKRKAEGTTGEFSELNVEIGVRSGAKEMLRTKRGSRPSKWRKIEDADENRENGDEGGEAEETEESGDEGEDEEEKEEEWEEDESPLKGRGSRSVSVKSNASSRTRSQSRTKERS